MDSLLPLPGYIELLTLFSPKNIDDLIKQLVSILIIFMNDRTQRGTSVRYLLESPVEIWAKLRV